MNFHWISKKPSCFFSISTHSRGEFKINYIYKLSGKAFIKHCKHVDFFRRLHSSAEPLCTHYKTLEINEGANEREIREAYLSMCKRYHPDVNKTEDAEAKFR